MTVEEDEHNLLWVATMQFFSLRVCKTFTMFNLIQETLFSVGLTFFGNAWKLPMVVVFAALDSNPSHALRSLIWPAVNIDSYIAGKDDTGWFFLSSKLNFVVNWLASWPCRLLTSTRASKIDGFNSLSWCTEAFRSSFCYLGNTKFLCSTLFRWSQGLMSWEAGKCPTGRQCLEIKGAEETESS